MTIDKQQLQRLLWAEAASFRADCADWKRNTEALDEFLGEKTVGEVALELLSENEALRNALRPLLAHWDDLKAGESINVDAARAVMGKGEPS